MPAPWNMRRQDRLEVCEDRFRAIQLAAPDEPLRSDPLERGGDKDRRVGRCDLIHVRFVLQPLAEKALVSLEELLNAFFFHR